MPLTEWNPSYALGVAEIDLHHQHLFALLNNFYDLFASNGRIVQIEEIVEELINYATYHFAAEEQLMIEHCYPYMEEHLAQHEDFIRRVIALHRDLNDGRSALSLELIVFLRDWLRGHILECDRAFANFVRPRLDAAPPQGVELLL